MKIGRNESCPCGSGKKYKKCCLERDSVGMPPLLTENAEPEELSEDIYDDWDVLDDYSDEEI